MSHSSLSSSFQGKVFRPFSSQVSQTFTKIKHLEFISSDNPPVASKNCGGQLSKLLLCLLQNYLSHRNVSVLWIHMLGKMNPVLRPSWTAYSISNKSCGFILIICFMIIPFIGSCYRREGKQYPLCVALCFETVISCCFQKNL